MNRHSIVALPHPRLREKSAKISQFNEELVKFIQEMTEASLDWEDSRKHEFCVGLAAVQVDELKKIVILRDNLEDKEDKGFTALVNPKIIKTFGTPESDFEGCLSVVDIYGKVPRYPKIKVKAQDINGSEIRITAEGFLARLLQHEIDHVNGIVFIDHIRDNPEAFFKINDEGKIEKLDYDKFVKDSKDLW